MLDIIQADIGHIPLIAPLFDKYRIFYKQTSDLLAAHDFLKQRFSKEENVIFLALEDNTAVGFVQLYTTFSSVSLQHVYILNDLYVEDKHRQKGIGKLLLEKAKSHCKSKNYKGLALETAIDNPAQKLYEQLGWKKDSHCYHYFWTVE
jgi:GNAT superfamily N-acetyltransferase